MTSLNTASRWGFDKFKAKVDHIIFSIRTVGVLIDSLHFCQRHWLISYYPKLGSLISAQSVQDKNLYSFDIFNTTQLIKLFFTIFLKAAVIGRQLFFIWIWYKQFLV